MKRTYLIITLIAAATSFIIYFSNSNKTEESIIFFPLSDEIYFTVSKSRLSIPEQIHDIDYKIEASERSQTNEKVYLRQDISLIYENGKLIHTFNKWLENKTMIEQLRTIAAINSKKFQMISFHYGEIHQVDNKIKSVQRMSSDELYVIKQKNQQYKAFKNAESDKQRQEKEELDIIVQTKLKSSWNKLIDHFKIKHNKYHFVPLPQLLAYNDFPYRSLSKEQTQKMIGQLWEGLYKGYLLGLKSENGTVTPPIGSTIPLVLIAKDYSHLIILIEGKDKKPYQFIQKMTD